MRMEMGLPFELEKAKKERWPLCIPVGVMEYHADHCALGCDVIIPSKLLEIYEENHNIIIAPPIWYGVCSYCVAGPEHNSIHVDSEVILNTVYCISKSLLNGGWRNIYFIVIHQSEAPNPLEIACMAGTKKAFFEFAEVSYGSGWWGNNENGLPDPNDNIWNWIKVIPVMERKEGEVMPLDHAGYHETSLLMACAPDAVNMNRFEQNGKWFYRSAKNASCEHGNELIDGIIKYWEKTIK
jgi:creatinine amidohydrolase